MTVVTFLDYVPLEREDSLPWTQARIDEGTSSDGPWTTIDTITLDPVEPDPANPLPRSFTTALATLASGWYRVVFLDAAGDEEFTDPVPFEPTIDPKDIRILVPRIRRALDAPVEITDGELKDKAADAVADVMLYTGGLFGKQFIVTLREGGIPVEYATSAELSFPEQSVIAAQAALTYFFLILSGQVTSETIGDEASTWSWARSAQVIRERLKQLQADRDRALQAIGLNGTMDSYISFLSERDAKTSRLVEPWVYGVSDSGLGFAGGQDFDPRFGVEA